MKIDQEILVWLITGGIGLAVAVPVIAIFVRYVKDINQLGESRREKKSNTPQLAREENAVYHDWE